MFSLKSISHFTHKKEYFFILFFVQFMKMWKKFKKKLITARLVLEFCKCEEKKAVTKITSTGEEKNKSVENVKGEESRESKYKWFKW